jgi:hypothetical protein
LSRTENSESRQPGHPLRPSTFNARYRFRADPTWTIRESYRNQYDSHERKSYLFPENGFRDIFLTSTSAKWGLQA